MKVAMMIDGGFLRARLKKLGKPQFSPDYIKRVARACVREGEELFRIFFYDCAPLENVELKTPISGRPHVLSADGNWLDELATRDYFAVRRGKLHSRGWKLKKPVVNRPLEDGDFEPNLQQKGVDMRIGLDMANLSHNRLVDRIVLMTADTDFIPALKYARIAGMQIVAIRVPDYGLAREFLAHVDLQRTLVWP